MEKEIYEKPNLDIITLSNTDVVTTSGPDIDEGEAGLW